MKPYVNAWDARTLYQRNEDWIVRLEYVGSNYANESGRSSKFWSAENEGGQVRIRWGRIGTSGQSTLKTWSYFSEKFHEKEAKGYTLCAQTGPIPQPKTMLTGPCAQIAKVVQNGAKYDAFNDKDEFLMTLTSEGYEEIAAHI